MARAGIADPSRQARAMYASLGRGVFELLWLAIAPRARREAFLASVLLDDCPDGPCVLAASHTGNWEVAAAAAARTRRVAIVAKPFSWRPFDAFCTYLRKRLGVEVIRPDGAMAAARAVLREGGSIAMPIDQVPNRAAHGVPVDFLGAPVLVDRAPFVVAKRAGVPLLVIAASGSDRVEVLRRIDVDDIAEAAREATVALDAFVRREPASWMWLHRRWRAPRQKRGGRSTLRRAVAAAMLLGLVACRSAAHPHGGVPYIENDLDRALAEGRRTHRPVVVDAWASWCAGCRTMADMMADPAITSLHEHFVWASLDADNEANTSAFKRYPRKALPTLSIIEPEGGHVVFTTNYSAHPSAMRRVFLASEQAARGTDWDEASIAKRLVAALERDLPDAVDERAEIAPYFVSACIKSGQAERAIPFSEQLAAALPNNPGATANLGVVYFEAGRIDDARAIAARLAQTGGERDTFYSYDLRDRIEERSGNIDGRIAILEEGAATARRLGYTDLAKAFEKRASRIRSGRLVGGARAE